MTGILIAIKVRWLVLSIFMFSSETVQISTPSLSRAEDPRTDVRQDIAQVCESEPVSGFMTIGGMPFEKYLEEKFNAANSTHRSGGGF